MVDSNPEARPAAQSLITIVIPCYNEEANLRRGVLDEVLAYLAGQDRPWELVIADDGSSDASLALCRQFAQAHQGVRVFALPHGGKPAAVYGGICEACGDIVLFTDMDQSTPLAEMAKLLPWFDRGYEVVIGSRGLERAGFSLGRRVASRLFRMVRGLVLLREIDDTQCGFKALRRELAEELFPNLSFFTTESTHTGWTVSAFDVELLYLAQQWGVPIKEVEVEWHNRDVSTTKGRGKSQFMRESLEMARQVIAILRNRAAGKYRRREQSRW
jgi:dolichyl-phosphate beta-glucosyltransferase